MDLAIAGLSRCLIVVAVEKHCLVGEWNSKVWTVEGGHL